MALKNRAFILFIIVMFIIFPCCANNTNHIQTKLYNEYIIDTTPVKDQGRTGTCWSYDTLSFFETEIIRKGFVDDTINLSEMYVVYHTYVEKSILYLKQKGEGFNLSEGGLAFDVNLVIDKYGIVNEADYNAKNIGYHTPVRNSIYKKLKKIVKRYKNHADPIPEDEINSAVEEVKQYLDEYFGKLPNVVKYKDSLIEPKEYAEDVLDINIDDYIVITSFKHLPLYEYSRLNLPDNWQNYDKYLNVTLEDMYKIAVYALKSGYSISCNADISEPGANFNEGRLTVREEEAVENYDELTEIRYKQYSNGMTTDDHAMHIVGFIENKEVEHDWFYLKNSWGKNSGYKGFVYMSEHYFRLKLISFMINKEILADKFNYILPE